MSTETNANTILKRAVGRKWGWDEQSSPGSNARKEWWYGKLAEARRRKLLRCSEQQNHRCCYCGRLTWHPSYGETGPKRLMATLEHICTRSEGGSDNMRNLAMACYRCNNERSDHFDAVEFYEMVVGLRPRRSANKVPNPETLARKQESRANRQTQLMASTAMMLQVLNLWDWWETWLTHGSSVLEPAE